MILFSDSQEGRRDQRSQLQTGGWAEPGCSVAEEDQGAAGKNCIISLESIFFYIQHLHPNQHLHNIQYTMYTNYLNADTKVAQPGAVSTCTGSYLDSNYDHKRTFFIIMYNANSMLYVIPRRKRWRFIFLFSFEDKRLALISPHSSHSTLKRKPRPIHVDMSDPFCRHPSQLLISRSPQMRPAINSAIYWEEL